MSIFGLSDDDRKAKLAECTAAMERLSLELRDLILKFPPRDLISYIWSLLLREQTKQKRSRKKRKRSTFDEHAERMDLQLSQLLFEYIHAALATSDGTLVTEFDEKLFPHLLDVANKLQAAVFAYCMFSSAGTEDGPFGKETKDVEFQAKSDWVLIRGNRYQALEEEFYSYVLNPHDDELKAVYGIDAAGIAKEIQAIADAMRLGHLKAFERISKHQARVLALAEERDLEIDKAMTVWLDENPEAAIEIQKSLSELFLGDTGNVSKNSKLPARLLEDLGYSRGQNKEFFSPGPLCGTPMRTLPVRIKPLVQIGDDYFAIDACFIRDAAYRAILYYLLKRSPPYKKAFEEKQKRLTEGAFTDILKPQLAGSQQFFEVYFKDVDTKEWVETDCVVTLDDALIVVEAKSGAAATIASPAENFERHARVVSELIVDAYRQCERFLKYLASADEVPIYAIKNGKHTEVGRLRRDSFRLLLPIGLTVESFAPFSAMSKELPGVQPILGSAPYISMSIDDLFIIKRLLRTPGEFFHYLTVRQAISGIPAAHLHDEIDHLGLYLAKNRADIIINEKLDEADYIAMDGFCEKVDQYFGAIDFTKEEPPHQKRHPETEKLLARLAASASPRWLEADAHIRDLSSDAQNMLGETIGKLLNSLDEHGRRWSLFYGPTPLFLCVHRAGEAANAHELAKIAVQSAIAVDANSVLAIILFAAPDFSLTRAAVIPTNFPSPGTAEFEEMSIRARALKKRAFEIPKATTKRPAKLPSQGCALLVWVRKEIQVLSQQSAVMLDQTFIGRTGAVHGSEISRWCFKMGAGAEGSLAALN
jgi:hypothetical protein